MTSSNAPWSVKMADTVLSRWEDLPPSWSHEYAAMFQGMLGVWRGTGDKRYFNYVKRHIDAVLDASGVITGYTREKYSLDDLISGRMLFPLFDETGDARYKKAAATLREHYDHHPRTNEGGFWHNGGLTHQMFLDGIYMGTPFYAEYAVRAKDDKALADAIAQPLMLAAHNRDATTGLFYQGYNEDRSESWANPQTGCSRSFMGRATGWYVMALADLLDIVPREHAGYGELLNVFTELMAAVFRVQDPASGAWWQVLDQGGREGNYLESSASFMFLYAAARGLAQGNLSPEGFRGAVEKGFAGCVKQFIREEGGLLTVTSVCKTAGLGVKPGRDGSFAYYISEPVAENDYKGVAGFLLAASACEALDAVS